jgi:hypothetical protein
MPPLYGYLNSPLPFILCLWQSRQRVFAAWVRSTKGIDAALRVPFAHNALATKKPFPVSPVKNAKNNVTGFKTIKKLLTDKRVNK